MTITTTMPGKPATSNLIKTIAWVGLLAGTLDISFACTQAYIAKGISPVIVLQYVASGWFGKAAFSGGAAMALCGLLFHYLIACSFTAFFFWIYPYQKWLSKNVVATAIVYGLFVYAVTTFIVVPLSRIGALPFRIDKAVIAAAILIVAIGLPLSFFARRFYYGKAH
jgi:hypothetical protein